MDSRGRLSYMRLSQRSRNGISPRPAITKNGKPSLLYLDVFAALDFQNVDSLGAGPDHVVLFIKRELAGDAVEVFHGIQEFLDAFGRGPVLLHAFQEHGGGIVVKGRKHDVYRVVVLFGQFEVSLLKSLVLGGIVFFVVLTPDHMAFGVR